MPPAPTNRLISIQVLRAAAAWMVVLYHYVLMAHAGSPTNPIAACFLRRGMFGVDVFFVIRGFVMVFTLVERESTMRRYFAHRAVRIVPAYWAATLLLVALAAVYSHAFEGSAWTLRTLVRSLLFLPSVNPGNGLVMPFLQVGWTLNLEAFFYVLLGLCLPLGRRARFIVCAVVLLSLPFLWPADAPYAFVAGSAMLHRFVAGMAIGWLYVRRGAARGWIDARPIVSATICSGLIALLQVPGLRATVHGVEGVSAPLLVVAALSLEPVLCRVGHRTATAASHLGDISYSTYLLHTIVLGLLLHHVGRPSGAAADLGLFAAYATTVLATAHVSYRWIERNPTLHRLRDRLAGTR